MSFVSYKYLYYLGHDKKTKVNSFKYKITDSEWVEKAAGNGIGGKFIVGAACAVIDAYEKRNEPVAPNLVLAFQYTAKRNGYTIERIVRLNKQHNPKYPKYEQEVQKYLMLL